MIFHLLFFHKEFAFTQSCLYMRVDVALLSLRRIGEVVTPGKLQERLDLTVPLEEDTLARDFGVNSDENGNASTETDVEPEAETPATPSPSPATAGAELDTGCKWMNSKEQMGSGSTPAATVGCALQVAHEDAGGHSKSASECASKSTAGGSSGAAAGVVVATASSTSFASSKDRARAYSSGGDRRHSHGSRRGSRPAHRKRAHSHEHEHEHEEGGEEGGDDEHGHSHKVCSCSGFYWVDARTCLHNHFNATKPVGVGCNR